MKIVPNEFKYWGYIFDIRKENEEYFGSTIPSYKIHELYMKIHNDFYFICLSDDDEVLGWCGVVNDDIRICVSKSHQSKGVGSFMLSYIVENFPNAKAKVKIRNEKSLNLFRKFGFVDAYICLERK